MDSEQRQVSLQHLSQVYWHQFNYHREKEYRIFVWTTAILLAGIAALLNAGPAESPIYLKYGVQGRTGATLVLGAWTLLAVWMQIRERIHGDMYAGVLVRLARYMHCFEKSFYGQDADSTVLEPRWQEWETEEHPKVRRLLFKNFIPATFIIGIMSHVVIWLR